ncbi:RteC domain-containing protein [Pedobacter nutrimenti]|uniref:RteC domain-containing protein n=1 Tax=Pedobacter nutrimenti TaxID=1241337 RepID=UPI00292FC36D|nr:RteC domain-containing protein [Pedobacter nutrimenti]
MIRFTRQLRQKLDAALLQVDLVSQNIIQKSEQSFYVSEAALKDLKLFLQDYSFKDEAEEIHFFKEIKPAFMEDLIYHLKVFYLECQKPTGSDAIIESYLTNALNGIGSYFDRNQSFYTYNKTNKTYNDHLYYTRDKNDTDPMPEYVLEIDPRFSTVHSLKCSKIRAYERYSDYLRNALYELHAVQPLDSTDRAKETTNWTESKVALVELAYALHARGAVNSGKADIKKLISTLEKAFNVKVGNFYRSFSDMSLRKNGRTPFLDDLKEYLNRYMLEGDR